MYRLVIADDEDAVRRCLISDVPWERYGFSLCGEAASGSQALELVERLRPHLLITDIRMDDISGLSVLEQVRSRFPATQVVILSAYSLFEYAQQAVLYSAAGYLTKPIESEQLEPVLAKVCAQLQNSAPSFSEGNPSVSPFPAPCPPSSPEHLPSISSFSPASPASFSACPGSPLDIQPGDSVALASEYIRAHFAEKLTLEQVAAACFVHPAHLSRQFRARYNTTFSDYLTQLRMKRAGEMLLSSEYRIREIAQKIGYDDYSYFCRVFRKITGVTPLEYRCNTAGGNACDE